MTEEEPTRPRDWPKKWVREETFWREMVTRTLSALLAALVIFLVALLAGVLPEAWSGVRAVGAVIIASAAFPVVFGAVVSLLGSTMGYHQGKLAKEEKRRQAEASKPSEADEPEA